jgi:4-carboxymuconolactone decarboxylase
MTRLPELRYEDLPDEAQQVWDRVVGTRAADLVSAQGTLAGPFNAFVTAPDTGRRLSSLGAHLRFRTSIDRRLSEVAIITVGARWQAEFEWWAHARMAREHGVAPGVIDAIQRGDEPPFGPAADDERTVWVVARQLATTGKVSPDAYAAAQRLLGDACLVELVALCGYYTLICFLLNAFDVPLPPGAEPAFPPAGPAAPPQPAEPPQPAAAD